MVTQSHPISRKSRSISILPRKKSKSWLSGNRRGLVEPLEQRTLLSLNFSLSGTTATVTPANPPNVDALVIDAAVAPGHGVCLEHSVNGGSFSFDWDSSTPLVTDYLAAAAGSTVNVNFNSNGSSLTLGTPAHPASTLFALFNAFPPANNGTDTTTIDDSASGASSIYNVNTGAFPYAVTGPGINYREPTSVVNGGITLKGGTAADTYNVLSTFSTGPLGSEPVTINAGASAGNIVNVGNAGSLANIAGAVVVYDSAVLNIDDSADTTNATATLDNLSGNVNAPFELVGLAVGTIEWGADVTAVNITGGTSAAGTAGVTYNINNTQLGTTTTINGGPQAEFLQPKQCGRD